MSESESSLLNVFEIVMNGETRQLLCFLDPEDIAEDGIASDAIVGEILDDPANDSAQTFQLNPGFVDALVAFMNDEAITSEGLLEQAQKLGKGWLYLLDPRNATPPEQEPPVADLLGAFAVDDRGKIIPESFQYNQKHEFFDPVHGASGVFSDARFYGWLHQVA